jgi:hypothetical protein
MLEGADDEHGDQERPNEAKVLVVADLRQGESAMITADFHGPRASLA